MQINDSETSKAGLKFELSDTPYTSDLRAAHVRIGQLERQTKRDAVRICELENPDRRSLPVSYKATLLWGLALLPPLCTLSAVFAALKMKAFAGPLLAFTLSSGLCWFVFILVGSDQNWFSDS